MSGKRLNIADEMTSLDHIIAAIKALQERLAYAHSHSQFDDDDDKKENFNREELLIADSSNDASEGKSCSDADQQDLPSVYLKESSMPPVAGMGYDLSNFPLLPKPIIELGSPKSGFRLPSSDRVDARLDEKGATSKDQWTRVADQPKVGVLSDSTTTEDDQSDDPWISKKGHVKDHPSLKDNFPNEDLVQDQPPAFQPNYSPETTFRFGAVGDGAKRANLAPPKLKMQPYGGRSIIYHSYYEEQGLGLSNLWVRVTASLKDNLPNEDLLQDQPPAFQPN